MNTFIVIPTNNEASNLEKLVDQIFALHPDFHILIADENSPDGTGDIAERLGQKNSHIHVMHRPKKAGLGRAYIECFKQALSLGADLLFEMDANCSHDSRST